MSAVLVLRRGGLGDTLLMLPLLRALRRAHAQAALHFAGVREYAELFLAHGVVDAVRSSEDLRLWDLPTARERLRDYTLVVGDEPAVATVALDVRARPSVPMALQFVEQMGLRAVWPEDAWFVAPRQAPAPAPAAVVLAPGSGGRTKCWPRAGWLEVAGRLAPRAVQVLLGPVEQERDDPRRWTWPVEVEFVVEPRLPQVAQRLAGAGLYIGNDSGPTHLAAMLGVPTLALFGATDAEVWAPVGPHVQVLVAANRTMTGILSDDVVRAAAVAGRWSPASGPP